jgi:hypothetical protein
MRWMCVCTACAWARSRVWVKGGRWSVRRGVREVVRPLKGHSFWDKMRRDDCSDGGVSDDGGDKGAWWWWLWLMVIARRGCRRAE